MEYAEMNDTDCVRRSLDGDRDAYAFLVRRHQGKVLSLCLSLLRVRDEAEDAAQDVFIKAYRGLSGFRFESSFSTWLYRIAYSRCLDLLRSRRRRPEESLEALTAAGVETASAATGLSPEERADLERALEALRPEERLILTLRESQGLSYEELTEALDISLDAVKSRLRRARRALQERARHFFKGESVQMGGGKT